MNFIEEIPKKLVFKECEKHGRYEVKFEQWPLDQKYMVFDHCPECAKEDRIEEERKEQERQLEILKTNAGLNKRHFLCSFENYLCDTKPKANAKAKAEKYVKSIADGGNSCLMMIGPVGTGKTHLGAAMIDHLVRQGFSCLMIKMPELIRNFKATWERGSRYSESQLLDRYSGVDLLIIDEIGIQYGSDTEKLFLSEVVDNRYQSVLPTVLISNLDVAGVKGCIGERSYDRLREGGGSVIAFNWESERPKV